MIISTRHRTGENGKSDPRLSAESLAQFGQQPPVIAEVIELSVGESQPALAQPASMDGSDIDYPAQGSLRDPKLVHHLSDRSHENSISCGRYKAKASALFDQLHVVDLKPVAAGLVA